MFQLQMTLQSLVRETRDPLVVIYVLENLGRGVPTHSEYYSLFTTYRQEMQLLLIGLQWNPQKVWGPRGQVNANLANVLLRQQEALRQAIQDAEYQAFMAKQLQQMAQEQAKQAEMIDGLLRELSKEEAVVIANKLIDPDPMMRWLAVQVGGKKRMPIEHDLIKLLADPHLLVRQAAHDALFRLSRGTDFGPDAKATAKQIASSQVAWREWLAIQTDSRLSLATPITEK